MGVDWDGPLPGGPDASVDVPITPCPISTAEFLELPSYINPLGHSCNHGIDIYLDTLQFVRGKLSQ